MKVLFAVNNDNISDTIVKKYQKEYKEIISYKNVYYFNAVLKELQNNKNYDSVVISEDLEPFANNNFDTIDKFLFEKLDKISDEATKANGNNIEIILICSDRRNKSDEMLTKIFGIGIYNALIGEDRTIDNLCKLINQPRNKKEAKIAYKIDGTNIGYQAEDENNVSEAEVQNILAHYKRLGKDEDKYVDSFNNIVSQYTDKQLKIIIRYLPLNVKAVLEERSPKYQELATVNSNNHSKGLNTYRPKTIQNEKKEEKINVKMLEKEKDNITKPIVIPSALKINNKTKVKTKLNKEDNLNLVEPETNEIYNDEQENIEENTIQKKGRGRPRKNEKIEEDIDKPKRGRGRPKKTEQLEGKPEDEIDLFSLENNNNEENELEDVAEFNESQKYNNNDEIDLFNIENENLDDNNELKNEEDLSDLNQEDADLFNLDEDEQEEIDLFNLNEQEENDKEIGLLNTDENQEKTADLFNLDFEEDNSEVNDEESLDITESKSSVDLNTFLTKEKKVVSFVGTTKNGTSFIVNNLALILSSMNISTAILDLTKSKNAYYIYTKNEQKLRDIAENSILNLSNGITNGIEVNKNLTVYTELPGKEQENIDTKNVLKTLLEKYNVVLIDADFNTPIDYFDKSQEIYLVQSMDILTIQPLTAFLRMLKAKNVLKQEKLKVIINKYQKMSSLSDKVLIGGISSYNDPAMSYMTELFDKDKMTYCTIPFEIPNYIRYINGLVNCELSLKGYTKQLIYSLNELAGYVYPLINKETYSPMGNGKKKMQFSDATNNTLNKMKNNY